MRYRIRYIRAPYDGPIGCTIYISALSAIFVDVCDWRMKNLMKINGINKTINAIQKRNGKKEHEVNVLNI